LLSKGLLPLKKAKIYMQMAYNFALFIGQSLT